MALNVANKSALVTGGGSGICLELSRRLVENGCDVLIVDIQLTDEANELLRGSASEWGASAKWVQTDVTDWKQLQKAFEKCLEEFGRLDIVVPGAGVFEPSWSCFWEPPGTALSKDVDRNYKVFDVNVSHPIRATQLALDHFVRQKQPGVVCCIASIAAQLTLLPVPLYCASKHAIAAFVRSMALLEPHLNVRVNAVAPGIVDTPLWPKERLDWVDGRQDKWVTKAQVVDAMMGLITDPAMVGGTVLEVLAESTRNVELLNDPGPQGTGSTLANIGDGFNDVFGQCPRLQVMREANSCVGLISKNFGK